MTPPRPSFSLSLLLVFAATGCSHLHTKLQCKKEEKAARSELKDALAAQELEQCKIATKTELERSKLAAEQCNAECEQELARQRACIELQREQLEEQYQERLRTQLGLNFNQQVEVGQLQVNFEELEKLVDERKKEHQEMVSVYERLEGARRVKLREQMLESARQALESGDRERCHALLQSCACGQYVATNDCAQPVQEKLQDLAELREPLKRPILPTEIPLMLPIKLNVEMDNPTIENARVQRRMIREPLKQCPPCAQCTTYSPQCPQCSAMRNKHSAVPPAPSVEELSSDRQPEVLTEANAKTAVE